MYKLLVFDDLHLMIEQMHKILTSRDPDAALLRLRIDFQNDNFVNPTILALLAAFVEKLRRRHDVQVKCINMHDDNIDYISRMDFFSEVRFDYEEYFTRREGTGRFIPITRITAENRHHLTDELTHIIRTRWGAIHPSVVASLDWTICEIFDNIFNHSQTKIDGFVVAQYYPNKDRIDMVVIDGGIGIPRRLKQRAEYSELTGPEALELCVEKDVTVDPETNKGAGLFYTKRIVEENGGMLIINSSGAQVQVNRARKRATKGPKWTGTIVRLRIRTDVMIDPERIWGQNLPASILDQMPDSTLW